MAAIVMDFVSTNVGNVQVRRGGDGNPLVYLHSSAGEGEGLALFDELAARHAVRKAGIRRCRRRVQRDGRPCAQSHKLRSSFRDAPVRGCTTVLARRRAGFTRLSQAHSVVTPLPSRLGG